MQLGRKLLSWVWEAALTQPLATLLARGAGGEGVVTAYPVAPLGETGI